MTTTAAKTRASAPRAERRHLGAVSRGRTVNRQRREPVKGDAGLFGQHLSKLVEAASMSTAEFAAKIGKDPDTVTLYFSGERLPKPKDYRLLAKVLGLKSIRELLPDLDPRKPGKK